MSFCSARLNREAATSGSVESWCDFSQSMWDITAVLTLLWVMICEIDKNGLGPHNMLSQNQTKDIRGVAWSEHNQFCQLNKLGKGWVLTLRFITVGLIHSLFKHSFLNPWRDLLRIKMYSGECHFCCKQCWLWIVSFRPAQLESAKLKKDRLRFSSSLQ